MALKSRLELEVDGRSAEQQVNSVRVALEALTQSSLKATPAINAVFTGMSGSLSSVNAATASLNAVQTALAAIAATSSKTVTSLATASVSLSSASANAANAEARLTAATRAMGEMGAASTKAGSALTGAASNLNTTGANAGSAEARLSAATRSMNDLQQASARASSALNGVGGTLIVATRNVGGAVGAMGGLNNSMASLRSTVTSLAGPFLTLFGTAKVTSTIYQASEAYSTLTNRLKLVTDGSQELIAAQQNVFNIAQASRQPLTSTAELFQRIATNQRELGLSGKGVADVVGTISKTLAVSGASAASANAALIQLGQAFASGVLRGEELNSVMEQAPALAQAIAAGMGKTVGELRTLGAAGLLTADAVVKALQSQRDAVEALFNKTNTTIGQSITATGNSLTQLVGTLDQASGASARISAEILSVSKYMDSLTGSGAEVQKTLDTISAALNGAVAGAMTLVATKTLIAGKALGTQAYAYYANRNAAIAAAQAQANKSRADVIAAETALGHARADATLYRGTILQIATTERLALAKLDLAAKNKIAEASSNSLAVAQGRLLGVQSGLIGRIDGLVASARGLLGVLGGPWGLAITVATVVGSYLLFKDSSDKATKSLIDQGLSVEEATKKFKELSAEQKRYQEIEWAAKQKEATEAATQSVQQFTREGTKALSVYGYETNQYREKFLAMLDEVRGGTRTLDSVIQWAKENTSITETQVAALARLASEQSTSSQLAERYAQKLGIVTGQTNAVAKSTQALAETHAEYGKQTKAQAGDTEKLIAKMREEVTLYGASEKAIAAYNATKLNMTAEQREQVRILGSIKDAQDAYKKAIQDNDKVQQEAARKQLVALFAQQQKAEDVATALKKTQEEAAKAAEESAKRQITAIEKVAAASYASLMVTSKNQPNLSGYGLLTNGGTPPAVAAATRKTPQQQAAELMAQISETVSPNKSTLTPKTVREDAGQKMLDDARQRYAVLQQQSREIEAQGTSTRTLGTEAKKLIELETEISTLKTKGTLTTTQKQVLAMAEMNLKQQKINTALEKANELTKEQLTNQAKLVAFRENLTSQLELSREGQISELAGAGQGDLTRRRLQEDLKIRQDYQKQIDKLNRDYNRLDDPSANDTALYEGETQALRAALATRMVDQQNYYVAQDEMRAQWLTGVSESWQNYVDMATDYNSQARAATESILSDTTASISDSIQGLIKGTESLGDAFGNLASTMANSIISALSEMAAQWLVYQAVQLFAGKTSQASAAGQMAANATATSLQAGLAAFASTAAIPIFGPALAPAAMATALSITGPLAGAVAAAATAGVGFSEGGYTGAGGKYDPAGIVHKGEVVWSQADVRRFGGVAAVEGLRTGNVAPTSSAQSGGLAQSRPSASSSGGDGAPASITPIYQTIHVNGDVSPETVDIVQRMGVNVAQALRRDIDRNGPIMQSIRRKL